MSIDVGTAIGYLELDTTKWKSGIKSAFSDLDTFKDKSATASDKAAALSSSFQGAGSTMTKSFTLPIVGAATAAVALSSNFDSGMSKVQAITAASGSQMKALRADAIKLGADTAFSASQAAEGMANLGSAGFSTSEIIKAMPGMLDMAASSGTDLATASDIAASTLRGFALAASDAGHVSDVYAKAAAETNAGVTDMGEAMKYVAPVAHSMNQSLEETAAAVGILSNSGIKGSQAGTTLREAFTRLANPTKEMKETMSELNLKFYDAQGKMLPLNQIIGQLQEHTKGLTQEQKNQAFAVLFGTNALSGMMTLANAGSAGIVKLTNSLKDSDGAAKDMAKTMLNNLKGSVEQLSGSAESLGIMFGDVLTPYIKALADKLTNFVNWLSKSDESTRKAVVAIALLVAGIGPALLIIAKLITFALNVNKALVLIMNTLKALRVTMVTALGPVGAIILAITAVIAILVYLWKTNEGFRDAVKSIFNDVKNTIVSIFTAIGNFFTKTIPAMVNKVIVWFQELPYNIGFIIGEVIVWFQQLPGKIYAQLLLAIANVEKFGIDLKNKAVSIATTFVSNFIAFVRNLPSNFQALIQQIITFLINLPSEFKALGSEIMNGLWDGLKEIWDSIYDWFTGVINAVKKFVQGIKDGMSSAKSSSSSATKSHTSAAVGLNYVPTDGFAISAHEGEAILTKTEAKNYRKGGTTSTGDTYNFYSPKALTATETTKQIKRLKKQLLFDM